MTEENIPEDLSDLLAEARARQRLISDNMPEGVDPRALTLASKTPYVAMCFREAQLCRAEEFARAACDMFERDDVVVGISNTRSFIECVAALWYLHEKIEKQSAKGLDENIHEQIMQLVMGFRSESGFPVAINVLTMIDRVDANVHGFRKVYDRMSEFAHPNYSGALGAYGDRDAEVPIVWFKKSTTHSAIAKRIGLRNLVGGLRMLEIIYNSLAGLMPAFCKRFDDGAATA